MPRDAASTREQLVEAGRRLFARQGLFTTSLRQVVESAGQRNTSALHYHFGGRDGLVAAIIEVHNSRIEQQRAEMLDALGDHPSLRELVDAVVLPQAALLDEPDGREFLAIISQLTDLFDRWDESEQATPPQALRAFRAIERALPARLTPGLRRERITRFLELVSEALGSRARQVDSTRPPALPADDFVGNLVEMAVGALSATAPDPTRPLRPAHAGSR
jgi:AcrR family transcriptional regulator